MGASSDFATEMQVAINASLRVRNARAVARFVGGNLTLIDFALPAMRVRRRVPIIVLFSLSADSFPDNVCRYGSN